jgi:hypothetical protein
MSAPSAVAHPSYRLHTARLDRAIQATLKRNVERRLDALPWDTFDATRLTSSSSSSVRDAFGFYLTQMYFTEASSPENLAALSAASPVAQVQQAFAAQIQDELAHGALLGRYVAQCLGDPSPREHVVSFVGRASGKWLQGVHPVVGAQAVTMAIEYYASNLAEALLAKVDEPLLRACLQDILKDEHRHRVLAVESVHLLKAAGVGQGLLGRATAALLLPLAEAWFRHVMNGTLRRRCGVLGIPFGALYERSVEAMRVDLAASVVDDEAAVA